MSNVERRVGVVVVQIEDNDLPSEVLASLDTIVVEDDLAQSAMFTLRFNDPQFKLIDGNLLRLGAAVHIKAGAKAAGVPQTLLQGEITALELSLEQHDMVLVVRGYDRSHRLHRGSKTRTFLKQTDSEITAQVAREAGLRADVEASDVRHEYVVQANQTDMAFLRERAARLGFRITIDDRVLRFRRAEQLPPKAPTQEWGSSLLSFRACLSAAAQAAEVSVRAWDGLSKRVLVGTARRATQPLQVGATTDGRSGGSLAEQAFSTPAKLTISGHGVSIQGEAERLAQAVLDDLSEEALVAEGLCRGEPALRAGASVEIKGVGQRLGGTYFVTASRHVYTPQEGYLTTFFVSGRRPTSLLAAMEPVVQPQAGVALGLVTNVNDPEQLGRVKVKLPWLDERHESDWVRVVMPGGGKGRGLFTPQVEDEVLVAFEHGDYGRPLVIGGLWNRKDRPPQGTTAGGKGCVQIETRGGHTLTLDDQKRLVRIETSGDLEIGGPGGKLSIAQSGVELSAQGTLTIKGHLVEINP